MLSLKSIINLLVVKITIRMNYTWDKAESSIVVKHKRLVYLNKRLKKQKQKKVYLTNLIVVELREKILLTKLKVEKNYFFESLRSQCDCLSFFPFWKPSFIKSFITSDFILFSNSISVWMFLGIVKKVGEVFFFFLST